VAIRTDLAVDRENPCADRPPGGCQHKASEGLRFPQPKLPNMFASALPWRGFLAFFIIESD